jgi:hypothetical protein
VTSRSAAANHGKRGLDWNDHLDLLPLTLNRVTSQVAVHLVCDHRLGLDSSDWSKGCVILSSAPPCRIWIMCAMLALALALMRMT